MRRLLGWTTGAASAVLFLTALADGQGTPGPDRLFKYERMVMPVAAGPNRLDVDVPLLAAGQPFRVVSRATGTLGIATGGLGDLRFYDEAGREIPYLLITPPTPQPEWVSGEVLAIAATKTTSGFEADLGAARPVDRLRVNGLATPFLKRLRLEGSGDRTHWSVLVAEGTLFDLPEERLQQLEIGFPAGEFQYFRLTWDDRTSARVNLPVVVLARLATSISAPVPLVSDVTFERRASEPGKTRYRIRLPAAQLPIYALELEAGALNILRHARVTESRLSQNQVEPIELGSATLRRTVRGDAAAAEMRIPIGQPSRAELELTIDNASNPPLDVTAVRAVFADLPWIYVEAPQEGAITARVGNERVQAPRYDLEAARSAVAAKTPPAARWGEIRAVEAVTSAAAPTASVPAGGGGPLDRNAFRFSRQVAAGEPGPAAIRLDAAVLAHARRTPWYTTGDRTVPSFADVRLIDESGNQVPYLLEQLDEPLVVTLPPLRRATPEWANDRRPLSGAVSFYRLALPFADLPLAHLVLTTPARVFTRRLSVNRDPGNPATRRRGGPEVLGAVTWTHTDPDVPASPASISLLPSPSAQAWLMVEEGDNSPLPLDPPTLLLPGCRLRFTRANRAPLTLAYGDDELGPPQYDLALLAPALLGASAAEVPVGPEQVAPERTSSTRLAFWIALIGAVLVLLLLIARLVRSSPQVPGRT